MRANLAEWWWTDWHDLLLPDSQLANESLETITSYNCPLDTRMHPGYYNCASCTSRVYHMLIMNRPFSTWGTFYGYQGGSNSLALFNTSTWAGTSTCCVRYRHLFVQILNTSNTACALCEWGQDILIGFKTHRLSRPMTECHCPIGKEGRWISLPCLPFMWVFVIGSMFSWYRAMRLKEQTHINRSSDIQLSILINIYHKMVFCLLTKMLYRWI